MPGLIITNGDSAADLLRAAGRTETILPWRDVLHEGPISATDLSACTWMRVSFLARRFGLAEPEVAAEFAARDTIMRRHAEFETIELWFEHDLFDQLQLVQVLAFLASEDRTAGVTLVQADDFLGTQSAQTILRFARRARPLTEADLELEASVWAELASPTPERIAARVAEANASTLPFVLPALRRFLEELPSDTNGLGRTEQTILDLIASGIEQPKALFAAALRDEQAAFMGDWSFFRLIDDMAAAQVPLIAGLPSPGNDNGDPGRFAAARLTLTDAGEDVREDRADAVALSGLDLWWAGTRLAGRAVWRYDRERGRLVAPKETGA